MTPCVFLENATTGRGVLCSDLSHQVFKRSGYPRHHVSVHLSRTQNQPYCKLMSRLPSPLPDTSGSLFLHISSVPKINKTQFISSYVKEQTIHAKTYAAEGRAFERSWKQEVQAPMSNLEATPGPQKTSKTSKLAMDYGFETPVLKPRDAKRLDGSKKIPPTKDRKVSSVENLTHGDEVSKHKRKRKQRWSSVPRKGSSLSGSEKEYDQRRSNCRSHLKQILKSYVVLGLKERRERKRVKRAVMKSASNDNSLDESFAEGAKGKNKNIKKTAKNMGLAGLALMHGFTATNVGKGRLTVPLPFCQISFRTDYF